ncbi:MAG: Verru_Chthon cassette protein C [Verrucomicrobiae bacterium]|nr:Verru_Chthon cassette protein C [Verrucomicrobiae bacterium]
MTPTFSFSVPKMAKAKCNAFTLVELLVSMSILSVLLLLLSQLLSQVQQTWNFAEGRVSQFREARVAFDIITKNLSQASLNTYLDYDYDSNNKVKNYKRQSELHFLTIEGKDLGRTSAGEITGHAIFFQAPLGFSDAYRNLNNLFNARGYYLSYGDDERFKPSIVKSDPKYRFRLMEYRPPSEENFIYIDGDDERKLDRPVKYTEWFRHDIDKFSIPLAENVIALVISPRDTLEEAGENKRDTYSRIARDYLFDSNEHTDPNFRQQIPPLVRVTMVVIDDPAAIRLEAQESGSGQMPDLVSSSLFRETSRFDEDVETLKEDLSEKSINHKVFSTMVALRGSKWGANVPNN